MEWPTWMLGMLSRLLPWAGRSFLALRNLYRGKRDQSDDRFRFVLCWLDNDRRGKNTDLVAQAFTSIPGVDASPLGPRREGIWCGGRMANNHAE